MPISFVGEPNNKCESFSACKSLTWRLGTPHTECADYCVSLVTTLCVVTRLRTLRVLSYLGQSLSQSHARDAERPKIHYDAERRNEDNNTFGVKNFTACLTLRFSITPPTSNHQLPTPNIPNDHIATRHVFWRVCLVFGS
jgi:hypothetical protein